MNSIEFQLNKQRFERVTKLIFDATESSEIRKYWLATSERIILSTHQLESRGIKGKRVCELGPGGLGLACAKELNCDVTGFDFVEEFFVPIYRKYNIEVKPCDLNKSAKLGDRSFDFILFCEVIEHLARWPLETLSELHDSLAPGGTVLLSTQNLVRLSNRIRLARGRPLFVNFVPESMIMGHMREYCAEELTYLLDRAGFVDIKVEHTTFADLDAPKLVQFTYNQLCRMFPRLSNFIVVWARRAS